MVDPPLREIAIAEIQRAARRWELPRLPAAAVAGKTDAELLTWCRRLAALEFAQRFDPPHERHE